MRMLILEVSQYDVSARFLVAAALTHIGFRLWKTYMISDLTGLIDEMDKKRGLCCLVETSPL